MTRVLYLREKPRYPGSWVGYRSGLEWCVKFRPTGVRTPDGPASSESLRLRYPGRNLEKKLIPNFLIIYNYYYYYYFHHHHHPHFKHYCNIFLCMYRESCILFLFQPTMHYIYIYTHTHRQHQHRNIQI